MYVHLQWRLVSTPFFYGAVLSWLKCDSSSPLRNNYAFPYPLSVAVEFTVTVRRRIPWAHSGIRLLIVLPTSKRTKSKYICGKQLSYCNCFVFFFCFVALKEVFRLQKWFFKRNQFVYSEIKNSSNIFPLKLFFLVIV